MRLEEIYEKKCNDNSDICQHLPTLKRYAEKSSGIVELGVRSIVSTWAFLMGNPQWLVSVDIKHPSHYKDYDPNGCNLDLVYLIAEAKKIKYEFIEMDSLEYKSPLCDLMFFDTLHTYHQLSSELKTHHKSVLKYMIFHDTTTYANELMPAILEFMNEHSNWEIKEEYTNNNGLLILERK